MLYELELLTLEPVKAALIFGALLGLGFGALAQITRFCLRRGLVGQGRDRQQALGTWLTALLVALIATQGAAYFGYADFSEHRFAQAGLPFAAIVLGGLAFGAGMVLTRGCISRLTVLSASGNLRAVFVIATFAIVAHATLKGVLAPARVAIGAQTVDLGEAATASGWVGGPLFWSALAAIGLAAVIYRARPRPLHIVLAALIGLLVPVGWIGTGVLLYDEFEPIALESLSFTAPWSETLFWTVASSAIPAGFGTGLVAGVIGGAFLSAAFRGDLELSSFETPQQTLRYIAGGGLMGFGGVLAGGCTLGAGLSGVSTLSVSALLALGAIMVGARLTDRALAGQSTGDSSLVPAE
ncbi:MAG: YeeE/YedE family protein [Litoreibacter sp.]|nr:YeeE/YedE family protein [Litoreibacter sp.]